MYTKLKTGKCPKKRPFNKVYKNFDAVSLLVCEIYMTATVLELKSCVDNCYLIDFIFVSKDKSIYRKFIETNRNPTKRSEHI